MSVVLIGEDFSEKDLFGEFNLDSEAAPFMVKFNRERLKGFGGASLRSELEESRFEESGLSGLAS